MNAPAPAVSLGFAALNIDCAGPAALAEFWGKVLGRPVSPGAVAGDMAVDATDPASGPRLIFHEVSEPGTARNGLRPILLTEHHDEEAERLAGLGAKLLSDIKLPAVRHSAFADLEGNEFDLVTWQPGRAASPGSSRERPKVLDRRPLAWWPRSKIKTGRGSSKCILDSTPPGMKGHHK